MPGADFRRQPPVVVPLRVRTGPPARARLPGGSLDPRPLRPRAGPGRPARDRDLDRRTRRGATPSPCSRRSASGGRRSSRPARAGRLRPLARARGRQLPGTAGHEPARGRGRLPLVRRAQPRHHDRAPRPLSGDRPLRGREEDPPRLRQEPRPGDAPGPPARERRERGTRRSTPRSGSSSPPGSTSRPRATRNSPARRCSPPCARSLHWADEHRRTRTACRRLRRQPWRSTPSGPTPSPSWPSSRRGSATRRRPSAVQPAGEAGPEGVLERGERILRRQDRSAAAARPDPRPQPPLPAAAEAEGGAGAGRRSRQELCAPAGTAGPLAHGAGSRSRRRRPQQRVWRAIAELKPRLAEAGVAGALEVAEVLRAYVEDLRGRGAEAKAAKKEAVP